MNRIKIVCVIGPTGAGKSARAIELARERNGEVISVDSRQVYRTLDIGTEKLTLEEMGGIPHHLIDIRDPHEIYTAGDFARDARALIEDMHVRGVTPILAGGSHFYIDSLLYNIPEVAPNESLRKELTELSTEELFGRIQKEDPIRAEHIDPHNRRRLVRALEIISSQGVVTERNRMEPAFDVECVVINPPKEELVEKLHTRLTQALERGLIAEVIRTRELIGDARLNELGLEYRIVGEYLRGERSEESLLPTLEAKLWQYARSQKKWLRKLT